MNKINNFFRIISLASFGVGFYGVGKSQKIETIYNQLESERLKNQILQKKYEILMENKIDNLDKEKEFITKSLEINTDITEINNKIGTMQTLTKELNDKSLAKDIIETKTENIINIGTEISNSLQSTNAKWDNYIKTVENFFNSKGGNSGARSYFLEIDYLQNLPSSLTLEQYLAIVHISGSLIIISSLFSIISIFFGEKLIIFFNLEEKFPRIAGFIKLRRKFQEYYLILNILLMLIVSLIIIYINLELYF